MTGSSRKMSIWRLRYSRKPTASFSSLKYLLKPCITRSALPGQTGIVWILNPAPGQPVDIKEVTKVDYFIPNESEAETIAGKPVRTIDEANNCAAYFLERGIPRVILTLGSSGALFATPGAMELIPAFPVQTKDTTGAGDAFIGSFAEFLAEGISRERIHFPGLPVRGPVHDESRNSEIFLEQNGI